MEYKYSEYKFMPFNRIKIKIKKEIVTFDEPKLDVENKKGKYVKAENWNKLIQDKKTLLIDVRNNFEYSMGTFKGSINPKTKTFSEFKEFADNKLINNKNKKIAIFCTGGIRCEKASSYMLNQGYKNIYQLRGGILKYLEEISVKKSLWQGECFVFDNRVSVKNQLIAGTYKLCHGCRYPLSTHDRSSSLYIEGISCPRCSDIVSDEKKIRLKERNKQILISKKRGLYNPYIKYTTTDF